MVDLVDGRFRVSLDLPGHVEAPALAVAVRDGGAKPAYSPLPGRQRAKAGPIGVCWSTTGEEGAATRSAVRGSFRNCAGAPGSLAAGQRASVRPGTGSGAEGFGCFGIPVAGVGGDSGGQQQSLRPDARRQCCDRGVRCAAEDRHPPARRRAGIAAETRRRALPIPRRHALGLYAPGEHTGFIAQQVEQVFPDWEVNDPSGYTLVGSKGFDALTVEALRELPSEKDAEIAGRREENAHLAARLARSEAHLAASAND